MRKLSVLLITCVLSSFVSGCGGGSSGTTAAAGTTQGVDTPAAISVVTAK